MRFLLDTCVISELVRPRPDERVLGWIDAVDEAGLFLSSLTLGELEKGISKLPVSARRDQLRDWLERDLAARFSTRILPVDAAVALVWGRLQGEAEGAGMKLPVIDSLLAATAACHQLTLVTRNVADFARCGVPLLNPWNA